MTNQNDNTKICKSCSQLKFKFEFYPDKRNKDGCQASCKFCSNKNKRTRYADKKEYYNQKQREYYKNNKINILAINKKSRIKNREKILESKKIWYENIKSDLNWQTNQKQYRLKNKKSKQEYDKLYNEKNKQKNINKSILWNINNKNKRKIILFNYDSRRRAIKKEGVSSFELNKWANKQQKICYWCESECNDNYHIDHYYPLSKGGKHEIDNLVISCPKCNVRKNAKDPIEFANSVGRLF